MGKIQPLEARSSQGKRVTLTETEGKHLEPLFLGFNKTRSLGSGHPDYPRAITHCVTCFVGQGRDIHPTRMDFSLHSLSTSLRLEEIFLDRQGIEPSTGSTSYDHRPEQCFRLKSPAFSFK